MIRSLAKSVRSLVEAYAGLSHRRPLAVLGVFVLLTALAGWRASHLRIQTDLRVLLPKNTPSVQALELSEKRLGSTDFFTIAFQDSNPLVVARFQRALAESLETWPEKQWIQYDQDRKFFERHALLYMPQDELLNLKARLQAMAKKGATEYNPLFVDLEESTVPADLKGWPNPQSLYKQGIPMDVVESVLHRMEQEAGHEEVIQVGGKPALVDPTLPDSLRDRMMGWDEGRKMWVGVVMAQLNQPSTEAAFATAIKNKGDALILRVEKAIGDSLDAKVVGAYRDPSTEIDQINTDMWLSGILAIVLILGLLWYYMRRAANVVVVFVPLLAAMAWMMGASELVYGRLTVLTSFVLALLSGLGIEYNIHIYSRWMEERRAGHNALDAMRFSLVRTGRSLVSAMVAAIVCMLALQVGHFQGFKEFGVVISLGIFFAFLSSLLLLPPLLFGLLHAGAWARRSGSSSWDWLFPSEESANGGILVPRLPMGPKTIAVAAGLVAIATAFLAFAPKVQFENDFRNLRGTSTGAGISYGRAVGKGKNTTPSLILAESEEQMRVIHDSLGARFGTPADTMLKSFVTIQSFVPLAKEQEARLKILNDIRQVLDGDDFAKADSLQKAKIATLRNYTLCDTFGFDSLPRYARRFMTEVDGSHGKFGFIYGELRESDAVESQKFQDRFAQFQTPTGMVPVASTGFIYADVVRMVKEDAGTLAIFVFAFLAIVVTLDTRSWRGVVVNMGYIGLISLWTYWMMGWLDLRLGMFNIVVIPSLLSNTVDATIHLYHRRMESGKGKLSEIYHTAGSSVLAGTLTNAFGFLALCFVSHQGLRTIGLLASVGYSAGILIMFLGMPWLLEVICPVEPQDPEVE